MTDDLNELSRLWLEEKITEQLAVSNRRAIEDRILSLAGVSVNLKGTETVEPSGYIIKVTGRRDTKVDAEKVQEIAYENGLTDHLSSLFRWQAEVNKNVWKASDEKITKPFAKAITEKPGRPGFSITKK